MDKNTVLITGASGFIGTALITRLINNYSIIGIDKILHKDRDCRVVWYKADISNKKLLGETFSEIKERVSGKIDFVFHLAAYYDMLNRENRLYRETNENGTRYLLDNLVNFNVNNFIFMSSTAVVKPTTGDDKSNEESALSLNLYYGKSKIAGERIALEFKEKIKTTILRLSGVYSNDCELIPLANKIAFIWKKSFGYRILPGNGNGGLSYIHIEDVLDAFEKTISTSNEIPSGSIFILSEDDYVSIKEIYGTIFYEIYGEQLNFIYLPKWFVRFYIFTISNIYSILGKSYFFKPWMVGFSDKKYRFDTDKAKTVLGWQPRFQIGQHIKVIIKILKNDPKRWFKINKFASCPSGSVKDFE